MVFYQLSEKAKIRRHRTDEAIALAMQSRWEEAVEVNTSIIEVFPDDTEANNRLGKALTQLGRYAEARDSYGHALKIDPSNGIAKKNFDRLAHLKDVVGAPANGKLVGSHVFIEETGKSDVASLHHLAPPEVLAKIAAGDTVQLKPRGQMLTVESENGEYIGEAELKLGMRLIKLMEGGNRYAAAIASIGDGMGRVMIKEVFQHPSQAGRPSFPAHAADGFRPYVKESVLKYEREEDEEEAFEEDYPAEMEKEEPTRVEVTPLEEIAALEDEDEGESELRLAE